MNDSSYWGPAAARPADDACNAESHRLVSGPGNRRRAEWSAPVNVSAQVRPGATVSAGASVHATGTAAVILAVLHRRSVPLAILLAFLLGPLGLFYVSLLNGIAALVVLPFVVRSLAFAIAAALHGGMNMVYNAGWVAVSRFRRTDAVSQNDAFPSSATGS
jgi:hypothetical protein